MANNMEQEIARYEGIPEEQVVSRAQLFGLSTGGTKRDVIRRILEANITFWGTKEQERLLSIERCSKMYSLEEAQEACGMAALPTTGTLMDLCRRLVDAEVFPQDSMVEIMRRDSAVQTGEGLVCRICHLPATRLTSETCDKCFHKWVVRTKRSFMAAHGYKKPFREQRKQIQQQFLAQRGLYLGKGKELWK